MKCCIELINNFKYFVLIYWTTKLELQNYNINNGLWYHKAKQDVFILCVVHLHLVCFSIVSSGIFYPALLHGAFFISTQWVSVNNNMHLPHQKFCFDNHDCHIVRHFDFVFNVKLNYTCISNLGVLSDLRARILLYISGLVKAHKAHADFDCEILEL